MPHSRIADQFEDDANVERLDLDPTNAAPIDYTDPELTDEDRKTGLVEREVDPDKVEKAIKTRIGQADSDDEEVATSPGSNSSESSAKPRRSRTTKS